MAKNNSKKSMKFRRFIYRLGKYSMFVFTVITCYNITTHILELRAEKLRREKNKKTAIVVLSVIMWLMGSVLAIAGVMKYIKHLKKGYLLDLFDTEAYDVIDPEEEFPAESIIRSELCGTDDSGEHEQLVSNHIPLDEEATEEDYK